MLYPIPAVMVSCMREGERPNIITIAWAGTVNTSPAMVSISIRRERYSYDIIKESKEFVINLVNKELAYAADFCGVRSGRQVDKFRELGLTELESQHIKTPSIAESPLNIECRVKQILPLGSHDMFVAEVLGVTVEDSYLDEGGKLNLNQSGLVTYSHGAYFELGKKLGKFGFSVEKDRKTEKNGQGTRRNPSDKKNPSDKSKKRDKDNNKRKHQGNQGKQKQVEKKDRKR